MAKVTKGGLMYGVSYTIEELWIAMDELYVTKDTYKDGAPAWVAEEITMVRNRIVAAATQVAA